jgi:hypothetical protein
MDRFRQALKESDYPQAMACCSRAVRNAARQHGGAERFLRTVVPIAELSELTHYSFWHWRSKSGETWLYGCFLKLSASRAADPPVNWKWSIMKTEAAWVIDFPPIPLQEWIGMEQTRVRRRDAEHEARRQALQAKLPGVTTQLSCDRTQYRPGEPVLLKLALANGGKWELSYDDQGAAVNRSVVVTRADGQAVRWIGTYQQTNGAYTSIRPGETAVLFSGVDITRDYDMTPPGRYRIQFTGHALRIGEAIPRSPGMPEGAIEGMPSNVIEVEVR